MFESRSGCFKSSAAPGNTHLSRASALFRSVDYGHEEVRVKWGKDPRQYSTTTKEFVSDGNGHIKGVNTVEVEWTKTPTGQWSMKEVAGTEKYYPADLILLAMGFLGPEKLAPTEMSKFPFPPGDGWRTT